MIRILHCTKGGNCRTEIPVAELSALLQQRQGILWVDMAGEPVAACDVLLRETFGFHPLAVNDALSEVNVPKLDDWQEYLYIVLHGITYDETRESPLNLPELDIFLGKGYIVTYHQRPLAVLEGVWGACQRNPRLLKGGADHLLYLLADELVQDHLTAVARMQETLDDLEDQIFDKPAPATLEQVFRLKRALLQLRRIIAPQREVFNKLARDDYPMIDPKDRVYFRDVYDHILQLYDLMEGLRDLVSGAFDTYLSEVNNRMNNVMKTLTVVTTLFMPLTFITGFFGMNFFAVDHPTPFWVSGLMLVVAISAMLLIPILMYWWVQRRGWL